MPKRELNISGKSNQKNLENLKKAETVSIVTHGSNFHVDDLFSTACAVLLMEKRGLKKGKIKVKRSLDPKVWAKADILLDIGRIYDSKNDRFDHHQGLKEEGRKNGIPYSSVGLFWKKYGRELCQMEIDRLQVSVNPRDVAERVEEKLVMAIDAEDNGVDLCNFKIEDVEPLTLKMIVAMEQSDFRLEDKAGNSTASENSSSRQADIDAGFFKLLPFAKHLVEISIKDAIGHILISKEAEKMYKKAPDKRVLILPRFLGYGFSKFKEPLVTIYPDLRGSWAAKVVRVKSNAYESRILFPSKWAGLSSEELASVSGVPDAVFCHKGCFLAVAKSKEGAIEMVKKMFAENGLEPIKFK
jgi:uncharacterized UPF0160 family protein